MRGEPEPSAVLRTKTIRAFLIAKDAAANLQEFVEESSRMAFLAVRDCERELDQIERDIDEQLPAAITRVGERKARELLASLRFITDLERIGDLMWWVAQKLNDSRPQLSGRDRESIVAILKHVCWMLDSVHQGVVRGSASGAQEVIARDREIDDLRRQLFKTHLDAKVKGNSESIEILFICQALERAGDHITNLAEELIHLTEERSVRHLPKKRTER